MAYSPVWSSTASTPISAAARMAPAISEALWNRSAGSVARARSTTRATDRGQTILEDSSRIRMAHQFVRKQLNQVLPLTFAQSEDGSERTVFLGEPDRIRFVAPMPGYLGFGGPQVQELAIVRGGLEAGERVIVTDLVPVIEGMPLLIGPAAGVEEDLRRRAVGEAP